MSNIWETKIVSHILCKNVCKDIDKIKIMIYIVRKLTKKER